jgi:MFS family permease
MPTPQDRPEEALWRIVIRRAGAGLKRDALTPAFGRLLFLQGAGAAGDAAIAIALAGSLFFSVPEATARGKVALYLALTVAPFAVVSPLLARFLDRHRASLRWALIVAAVGRGILAWLLATRLDTLYLFPLAFGILLLSKVTLIVRGAVLPRLVPESQSLVQAGAALSRISAIGGILGGLVGVALIKVWGPRVELLAGALVYLSATLPALRLPTSRGKRSEGERAGAKAKARSMDVRQAAVAAAGMRFLVGFLVFDLAFALRREHFNSLGLGLLVGSATVGGLVGALVAPRLRRLMREEGIIVASLVVAGVTGLIVGHYFSVISAGALVFAIGVTSGALKVAFDAIVQEATPEGGRGWAFARFESFLQLAWVAGSLVPLLIPLSSGAGATIVGVMANFLALLYLLGRHRARSVSIRSPAAE